MRSNTEQLKQQLANIERPGAGASARGLGRPDHRQPDQQQPLARADALVMKHDSIADLKAPFDNFSTLQNDRQRGGAAGARGSPTRGILVYQNLRSRSGSRERGRTPPRFGGQHRGQDQEFQADDIPPSRPLLPQQIHFDGQEQYRLSQKGSMQSLGDIVLQPHVAESGQFERPVSLKKPRAQFSGSHGSAPAENLNSDGRAADWQPEREQLHQVGSLRQNQFDHAGRTLSNGRGNSPLRSGHGHKHMQSREELVQPYIGSNQDLNMFLVPNLSPEHSIETAQRVPVISPREVLQILVFENESSLRKIDLVKNEISQLQASTALMRSQLEHTASQNEGLQSILMGIQATDTDKSIAYLSKYVEHQRNTNQRLQKQIEDRDWDKKDAQSKAELLRLDNGKEKDANSLLDTEVELVLVQINKLEGQNQELQSSQAESLVKIRDDEADARVLEKQVKELEEKIAEVLKEKEAIVKELEEKADEHEKSMDELAEGKNKLTVENSQLMKVISAKVIFNHLDGARLRSLRSTFQEIHQYGAFDEKCHTRLQFLASFLYREGMNAKKQAISRWNTAILKPLSQQEQSREIAIRIRNGRLLAKPFHYLCLHAQQCRLEQHAKQSSLRIVKFLGKRYGKSDLKRSIQIWKDVLAEDRRQRGRLHRLVAKRQNIALQQAFSNWKIWSESLMNACRLELLKRECAHKLHYQLLTSNLRLYAANEKRVKYIKRARAFFALQNFVEYKRFYLKANLNTLRLRRLYRKYNAQVCLYGLRIDAESRRLRAVENGLEEADRSIESCHRLIMKHGGKILDREKRIAIKVILAMLSKGVYGYFQKWKQMTSNFNISINSKLRGLIIELYKERMRRAFYLWRRGLRFRGIQWQEHRIIKCEHIVEEHRMEVLGASREMDYAAKLYESQQRKLLSKALLTMMFRKAREGLYQWRRAMGWQQTKEGAARLLLEKVWRRHVGRYFAIYKKCLLDAHADLLVLQRERDFIDMQNQRLARIVYSHWCAFVFRFGRQKSSLRVLMKKIVNYKKHRGIKRWIAGCQFKRQWLLKVGQNSLISDLDTKHQVMVAFQNITDQQCLHQKRTQEERRHLARKTLMNYYTRFYTEASRRYFRVWQLVFQRFKARQRMAIALMHHRKRQMFNLTKSALQAHAAEERKRQKRQASKRIVIQQEEQQGLLMHEREQAKCKIEHLESQLETKTSKGQIYRTRQRIDKTMNIIINKNQKLEYISGKRAVFYAWRDVAKKQRTFLTNITRVCQKSFMAEGLARIHDASVKNRGHALVYHLFHKWYLAFNKEHLRVAWSRWKTMAHKQAYDQEKLSYERHQAILSEFKQRNSKIQNQNVQNFQIYFKKIKKIKILRAWKRIQKYNKMRRILTEESAEKFAVHNRRKFLQKWMLRIRTTKRLRAKLYQLEENYRIRMRIKVFEVLQFKKSVNNTMALSLHNFEKMMRQKMMADAFKDVTSFYLSKKHATDVFKKRATLDAVSLLTQRHLKVHRRVFNKYRFRVSDEAQRKARLRAIYGNVNAQRRHRGYRKWRELMEREVHVQEVNETGPITEHVFEANRLMRNLKDFMRSEGIPEEVIKRIVKEACDAQMDRMRYAVLRLRLHTDPNAKLKMKVFDHWKLMIKFRMLMKYWLVFGNNRVQWVKADIQEAFNKWRMGDSKRAQAFDTKPLKYLQAYNLKQTNELLLLANREAKCDVDLKDYSLQRDELLEHYIRGQRLALSACHERLLSGKKRAFSIWAGLLKEVRRGEGVQQVMAMVEKLAAIKDKNRGIEKENQELAQENEELRQFSMNGYKIAESVNQLSAEREKLTIDLADQAETIKNLLEQNRKLQKQIEMVRSGNKENKQMNGALARKQSQKRVTFDQVR